MMRKLSARRAGLAALALAAIVAIGCGKKAGVHMFIPNAPPTVEMTSAPVDIRDTTFYAYRISWSGNDPDGRIDHYEYAIDPRVSDTAWVRIVNKNEIIVFFHATQPVMGGVIGAQIRSVDPHTFVLRAVDNSGAMSDTKTRSFFSYTVAPTVSITNPKPLPLIVHSVTPSVRISWVGTDPDGQFTQKPVKYKYKLLGRSNPDVDIDYMTSHPDSLRRFYAKTFFASWDSVGGDTTTVQFTGLTPSSDYIFVVIAYDEAGAYSPLFTLNNNILQFQVGYATTLGPAITAFNEFFVYSMQSGGFVPNNPLSWVNLEVPANQPITFYWFADPPAGSNIEWYRWRVDGNVADETQRSNEFTDWYHWSQKGVGTTQCTIGPYSGGEDHKLYIEAQDNNQVLSILVIHFKAIAPTFEKPLLIVDDTRLEVDQTNALGTGRLAYTGLWPARAEMDTFLFARGNTPWEGSLTPGMTTYPGLFAGYQFDTLGTRKGYEIASNAVPLSLLGLYSHIIWMVDSKGGHAKGNGADPNDPTSALHYMCTRGHPNTLSTFIYEGGRVWMLGGTSAYATLIEYNASGGNANDGIYGPYMLVFSASKAELAPGRIMFDAARWQNEMIYQSTITAIIRSRSLIDVSGNLRKAPWTQPGFKYQNPRSNPDYFRLPNQLRAKAMSRGDTLPPTRNASQSSSFFSSSAFDIEYMSQPNWIIEDINADPDTVVEASTLDTLMSFLTGSIASTGNEAVCMTYYHGAFSPEFVFSGFDIWRWCRQDLIKVVDFVMQEVWKMPRDGSIVRTPQFAATPSRLTGPARPVRPAAPVRARVPTGRSSPASR